MLAGRASAPAWRSAWWWPAVEPSVFLAGITLAIAGVPFAMLLAGVIFACALQVRRSAQVPVLVLPAIIWLYWKDAYGWMAFLIVCTVFVVHARA